MADRRQISNKENMTAEKDQLYERLYSRLLKQRRIHDEVVKLGPSPNAIHLKLVRQLPATFSRTPGRKL